MGDVQVQVQPSLVENNGGNGSVVNAGATAGTVVAIRNANNERQQAVFEFTKRKKWADLLVTELAGTIILVLSPSGEVLYCGSAALELLGWKDNEVIDTELANWLHEDDVSPFLAHFDNCVASRTEMATFARLRGSGEPRWPVFELRGHPHYDPDRRECRCFFVMARPYPSRNTAMLDSFLELKIENERLRQRLVDLRPSASSYPPPPYLNGQAVSNVRGGGPADAVLPADSGLLNMGLVYNGTGNMPIPSLYKPHYFAGPPITPASRMQNVGVAPEEISPIDARSGSTLNHHGAGNNQSLLSTGFNVGVGGGAPGVVVGSGLTSSRSRPRPDDDVDMPEVGRNKKKARKANVPAAPVDDGKPAAPQYVCVTCGRTDSPEWRKGPLGAKTLCNACGLRWAKRNSKKKAEVEAAKDEAADSGKEKASSVDAEGECETPDK